MTLCRGWVLWAQPGLLTVDAMMREHLIPQPDTTPAIVPREKLDFGLDGDLPRFWLDNDPFKTRFFDAMSTLFPVGERFFISCVRDFRDQVTDPRLRQVHRAVSRRDGVRLERAGGKECECECDHGPRERHERLFEWVEERLGCDG